MVRGTKDCEIVPDPAPDNLDRLAVLATKIGGHTKLAEAGQRRIAGLVAGKNP